MAAARHDNAEAIEMLVKSGVEVDAKDDVSAKISSYSDILVLKAQAMVHNAIGDHGIAGVCPEGGENEQKKISILLAYVQCTSTQQCPHLSAVEHKWLPYFIQDFNTAILFAAKNASLATVQVLLENGAHIEAKNTTVIKNTLLNTEIL